MLIFDFLNIQNIKKESDLSIKNQSFSHFQILFRYIEGPSLDKNRNRVLLFDVFISIYYLTISISNINEIFSLFVKETHTCIYLFVEIEVFEFKTHSLVVFSDLI